MKSHFLPRHHRLSERITAKHRDLDIRGFFFFFYRDLGDDYVTRTIAFDRDMGRVQGALARKDANGGGDYPEAMDQGVIRAVGQDWRPPHRTRRSGNHPPRRPI